LERQEVDITHFITLTFWESLEAIRGFVGDDLEQAKYYPEDKDFLLEFEPRVVHYEVVGQGSSPTVKEGSPSSEVDGQYCALLDSRATAVD
jgi:hypothetical protein